VPPYEKQDEVLKERRDSIAQHVDDCRRIEWHTAEYVGKEEWRHESLVEADQEDAQTGMPFAISGKSHSLSPKFG